MTATPSDGPNHHSMPSTKHLPCDRIEGNGIVMAMAMGTTVPTEQVAMIRAKLKQ